MILLPDQLCQTRCVFLNVMATQLSAILWPGRSRLGPDALVSHGVGISYSHFSYTQAVQSDFRTATNASTFGTGNRALLGSFWASLLLGEPQEEQAWCITVSWDKLEVPMAWAEPWDSHKAMRNTHCIVSQMLQRIFQKINILSWQKISPL